MEKNQIRQNVLDLIDKWFSHRKIKHILALKGVSIWLATISGIRTNRSNHQTDTSSLHTTIDIKSEWWEVSVAKNNRIKTLEDLIEHCNIDLDIWDIDRHIVNKWEVGAKDENWKIITEPLYQVKARLKKKKELSVKQIEEATLDQLSELWKKHIYLNYKSDTVKKTGDDNKLLEVCIFDAHINKLCIAEQTGTERNHNIAKEVYLDMVDDIILRWKKEKCGKSLFIVGNDFFQADTLQQTTTKWTRVDTSNLLFPSFTIWQEIIIEAITKLLSLWPVDVLMIGGNHDKATTFFLWQVLSAWYRDVKDVTVNNSMPPRKYYPFGKCLIWFGHWETEKVKDIGSLMAYEAKDYWSNAIYKEMHLWHLHRQFVYENHWVITRYLNSISGTDMWHSDNCYVGSVRWWTAFVWHKKYWLEWQFIFNI